MNSVSYPSPRITHLPWQPNYAVSIIHLSVTLNQRRAIVLPHKNRPWLLIRTCFKPYLLTYLRRHSPGGWVEPASPIALTTPRTEALQARRSCANSLYTFTQSCLHRAWPKTRSPEIGSRSALIVVTHVFSWTPAHLRHVRGGVGRRSSLINSPSGRLGACPNQQSLLCTSSGLSWYLSRSPFLPEGFSTHGCCLVRTSWNPFFVGIIKGSNESLVLRVGPSSILSPKNTLFTSVGSTLVFSVTSV